MPSLCQHSVPAEAGCVPAHDGARPGGLLALRPGERHSRTHHGSSGAGRREHDPERRARARAERSVAPGHHRLLGEYHSALAETVRPDLDAHRHSPALTSPVGRADALLSDDRCRGTLVEYRCVRRVGVDRRPAIRSAHRSPCGLRPRRFRCGRHPYNGGDHRLRYSPHVGRRGMTDTPEQDELRARIRPRRWFVWVWVVPIVAAGLVIWLGWRSLADRGPMITIAFKAAEGLQAGQTKIQHRDVDVGTVQSVELTPDMSRVIVHARMTRQAVPYLNEKTRFYIVAPHVGIGGISGLSTIVSGSFIEMYPGKDGDPKRNFVALDEPPIILPDTPGRSFTLEAPDLGSLTRGSPISYNGVSVGEGEGYTLAPDGTHVTVTAFLRAPWDDLVHPETRFWNAGGVDLTAGAQGFRVRATSWQQLLSGGVAFETPLSVLTAMPSEV